MSIIQSKHFKLNMYFDALSAFVFSATGTLMTIENMKLIDYEKLALFGLVFNLFGILGTWIGMNAKTWGILQRHWKTLFAMEFILFPIVCFYTMVTGDLLTRWILLGTIVSLSEVMIHLFWEHMKQISKNGREIQATQSVWHQCAVTAGLFCTWLLAYQWSWAPSLNLVFAMHIVVSLLSTYSLLRLFLVTRTIE